ncbi:hypothetical protein RhiirA5_385559, partial [Rhizophagus irregularis]
NPKQKQASSHVSFPLVVTEQLLYNSEEEQATNEDEDVYFNEDEDDDNDLLGQHVNFDTPEYDGGIEGAELPIPDINAGFTWIVYWIFKYQERYRLPDTAIDSLLKFVRYILVLVDENTYSKFPKTLYMARKLFGIGNQLIKFATCKKCCKLYAVKDLPTDQPYHCTFQDYPNHPMSNLRSYCNNIITKQIPTNQGMMFKPSLIFPIISIKRRLQQLYNTKGFEESCRKWTNQPNNEKELADIFDGRIWKTFEDPNNSQLFFRHEVANSHLGIMMNLDWFQPFDNSQYSVGVIYGVICNLPRSERFKNVKEKAGIGSEPFPGALLKPKKEANLPQDILKLLIEYYNSAYDNYFFISLSDIHNALPEAIGVLPKVTKFGRLRIGVEVIGSTFSARHIRSVNVLSQFILDDNHTTDIYPGQVQFFFEHTIHLPEGSKTHCLAFVRWYKKTENRKYRFHCQIDNDDLNICNIELWENEFYELSRDCIIPIHNILGRFVAGKMTIGKKNPKSYLSVIPINRKIHI